MGALLCYHTAGEWLLLHGCMPVAAQQSLLLRAGPPAACRTVSFSVDCHGSLLVCLDEPVCASAHCRLIPYWAQKLQKREMLAYQASSRGGIIKCQNLGNRVLISGEAVTVFKGNVKTEELKKLRYVA